MTPHTCVVLVPGFKGSVLSTKGAIRPVWLTAGEALFGRRSLAYDRPDLGVPNGLTLEDGGLLEQVSVVPRLIASAVYAPTMSALRSALPAGWQLRAFHFDWRRDPGALTGDLEAFVAGLLAEGVGDVRLLAHSMGAMLTASWLLDARGTSRSKVSRAAFVAGAFRGTAKMFRNLQTGDDPTGLNTTLLSADALGTFPSSYHLMPDAWPFVVDEHGAPVAADLRDVRLWEERRWGVFKDGDSRYTEARRVFLGEQFARSRAFLGALDDPAASAPSGLKVRNLVGTSVGTLNQVVARQSGELVMSQNGRAHASGANAPTLEAPGDGTIAAHAAALPAALVAHAVAPTLEASLDHMGVVQGGPGLAELVRFLMS